MPKKFDKKIKIGRYYPKCIDNLKLVFNSNISVIYSLVMAFF